MKTPWHLWVVGFVSLVWNGMGGMDYVMTVTRNEGYIANFTAERLAFLEALPTWVTATWALAIWLAVAGSILLLVRSRFAVPAFLAGFVFMMATTVHNLFLAEVSAISTMNTFEVAFTLVIVIIAVALWRYAVAMRQKGVLR